MVSLHLFFLQDIRKVVQVLEQTTREILTVLQSVHQPSGFKESKHVFPRYMQIFIPKRLHALLPVPSLEDYLMFQFQVNVPKPESCSAQSRHK